MSLDDTGAGGSESPLRPSARGTDRALDSNQGAISVAADDCSSAESVVLSIDLLGQFRLRAGGAELSSDRWRSRKAASLVKLLALEPGHALHRERLCDLLWPTFEPAAAANNLRQTLYQARVALQTLPLPPRSLLCNLGERLALYRPDLVITDVDAFETAAAQARKTADPDAYWQAIECYRGPLLPAVIYEDWVETRRESLAALYRILLGDVAQLHEVRGEHPRSLDALQRLIASEPTDESAVERYMRLAAAIGHRSAAMRHYRALEQALARELDVEPETATRDLYHAIKDGRFSPASWSVRPDSHLVLTDARRSNLPEALSTFIGREQEIAAVAALVAEHRLVTLTGPGGIGKTRLALEVARRWLATSEDEVWLIELASLTDPAALPQAVGSALEISTEGQGNAVDALVTALRDRQVLLVLDNCEHLISDCAELVAALLAGAPYLRILATSRTALRLSGGQRWAVPELRLPEAQAGLQELARNDAVKLFVDRVRWRMPGFDLSDQNGPEIASICRQLEGVPLALELAAAKTSVLTISQLAERLNDALELLNGGNRDAPDRQQTLRATLDWSHALLDGSQQTLFRRLSVFSGGWTLEAAEAVCAGDGIPARDVLGVLEQLAEKSQVQVERTDRAARYRLLEPVRQYAVERLDASGEADTFHSRHAAYVLAYMEEMEPALSGPDLAAWFGPLDRERGNLRTALGWSIVRNDAATVLRLGCILARYWGLRWQSKEGLAWLEAGLALPTAGRTVLRALAARRAGELARRILNFDLARGLYEEALAISRELDDRAGVAWALVLLADILEESGEWMRARSHAQQSLEIFRAEGDQLGIAFALNMLAEDARFAGDYARAGSLYLESLECNRTAGDHLSMALQYHNLGYVGLADRDIPRAVRSFRESYLVSQAIGNRVGSPLSLLEGMGAASSAAGRPADAIRLYAAFTAACAPPGTEFKLHPADQVEYDRYLTQARTALGEAAFARLWAQGTDLPQECAIREALSLASELAGDRSATPTTGANVLTGREQDVANLVAEHLTNHQIAHQLGLSERTVDTHVSNILHKLHLYTRGQIAGRVVIGRST